LQIAADLEDARNAYTILFRKHHGKRLLVTHRRGWGHNIEVNRRKNKL